MRNLLATPGIGHRSGSLPSKAFSLPRRPLVAHGAMTSPSRLPRARTVLAFRACTTGEIPQTGLTDRRLVHVASPRLFWLFASRDPDKTQNTTQPSAARPIPPATSDAFLKGPIPHLICRICSWGSKIHATNIGADSRTDRRVEPSISSQPLAPARLCCNFTLPWALNHLRAPARKTKIHTSTLASHIAPRTWPPPGALLSPTTNPSPSILMLQDFLRNPTRRRVNALLLLQDRPLLTTVAVR